ncbi:hypothetical protein [Streptomyces lavendofoliae]|uniref:Uncharacterized protein n=1 Tax=Streptomyces lavendofoliae TaxID=67314 RepID=A0A918HUY5_9ACTN|nr:hypothetical protein [Streptomyces lavendofoliae]GGU25129.1 hypothetical protein GCM10010274_09720 [Streptomyces lavendofoliae]
MPHRSAASPIYDRLVDEHGDVLGEARKLAELTHREAERLLAWDLSATGADRPE